MKSKHVPSWETINIMKYSSEARNQLLLAYFNYMSTLSEEKKMTNEQAFFDLVESCRKFVNKVDELKNTVGNYNEYT